MLTRGVAPGYYTPRRWRSEQSPVAVLFEPVGNAAAGEIVRRHFHADAVANKNADTVLAHLAGHRRQHDVVGVIQLNFEECVGLLVDDSAFRRNQIVSGQ